MIFINYTLNLINFCQRNQVKALGKPFFFNGVNGSGRAGTIVLTTSSAFLRPWPLSLQAHKPSPKARDYLFI